MQKLHLTETQFFFLHNCTQLLLSIFKNKKYFLP